MWSEVVNLIWSPRGSVTRAPSWFTEHAEDPGPLCAGALACSEGLVRWTSHRQFPHLPQVLPEVWLCPGAQQPSPSPLPPALPSQPLDFVLLLFLLPFRVVFIF